MQAWLCTRLIATFPLSQQYSVSESHIIVDELLAYILVGVGFIPTRIQRADMKSAPTIQQRIIRDEPHASSPAVGEVGRGG